LAAATAIAACSDNGAVTYGTVPEAGVIPGTGQGIGQPCDANNACRPGLACNGGTCAVGHSLGDGSPCLINDECKQGDICVGQKCAPGAGTGKDGDPCKSDADCTTGFRCEIVGTGLQCKPEGTTDKGGACTTAADCYGGLACINKVCAPPPPGVPPIGVGGWTGAACADDSGSIAYFRVPRGSNDGDFYRLPFPNDVRLKNGHPDLSNHPSPGSDLLGYDIVDRYLRYVEQNTDGFSTYPTVFFRFSTNVDFDSLKAAGAMHWVDLTPNAPAGELGFGWGATTDRNNYICNNAVSIRPPMGAPLASGHTYAVYLTTVVVDSKKGAFTRADDLAALLGASTPSDASIAAAYPAYKSFRDYLAAKKIDPATVLNAAVFTTAHASTTASKLPAAVAAAQAPTASGWVKCDAGVTSPCPQATGDRACAAADPNFDELHALVTLPIFQKGNEPYTATTDGDFALAADGTPQPQRTENVCMSLTVPKGTMPAAGWPLVIYAHGTGGSFRSAINEGVAARLASVDDGAGGKIAMAVLGIDQVEHGPRRGSSTDSPDNLFYNFANPAASRGNPLQGAADQLALLAFAQKLNLTTTQSPTGAAIKFGAIAFWGHSQGATEGGISLAYSPGWTGAVLSGEGASLIDALHGKQSPVDIADALPFVLEESHVVDTGHPVLAILQNAIDPADPLNHAAALTAPATAALLKHVFQPFGIGDSFAPVPTEQTFAIAAALGVATPPSGVTAVDIGGATPVAVPVGGNLTVLGKPLTAIVREYQPSGYDGHFVAYKEMNAVADVNHFLADAIAGKAPKVGR
jgi:hypothetical protein